MLGQEENHVEDKGFRVLLPEELGKEGSDFWKYTTELVSSVEIGMNELQAKTDQLLIDRIVEDSNIGRQEAEQMVVNARSSLIQSNLNKKLASGIDFQAWMDKWLDMQRFCNLASTLNLTKERECINLVSEKIVKDLIPAVAKMQERKEKEKQREEEHGKLQEKLEKERRGIEEEKRIEKELLQGSRKKSLVEYWKQSQQLEQERHVKNVEIKKDMEINMEEEELKKYRKEEAKDKKDEIMLNADGERYTEKISYFFEPIKEERNDHATTYRRSTSVNLSKEEILYPETKKIRIDMKTTTKRTDFNNPLSEDQYSMMIPKFSTSIEEKSGQKMRPIMNDEFGSSSIEQSSYFQEQLLNKEERIKEVVYQKEREEEDIKKLLLEETRLTNQGQNSESNIPSQVNSSLFFVDSNLEKEIEHLFDVIKPKKSSPHSARKERKRKNIYDEEEMVPTQYLDLKTITPTKSGYSKLNAEESAKKLMEGINRELRKQKTELLSKDENFEIYMSKGDSTLKLYRSHSIIAQTPSKGLQSPLETPLKSRSTNRAASKSVFSGSNIFSPLNLSQAELTPTKILHLQKMLQTGHDFWKHSSSRRSRKKLQHVFLSLDTQYLCYTKPELRKMNPLMQNAKKKFPVSFIQYIERNGAAVKAKRQEEIKNTLSSTLLGIKKDEAKVDPNCMFSIVMKTRTLDLEAKTPEIAQLWAEAFEKYINSINSNSCRLIFNSNNE